MLGGLIRRKGDDMGFVATAIALAGAASAGATVYAGNKSANAAKKAQDTQNEALRKQIESSSSVNSVADAQAQAADKARKAATARAKGYTPTILTSGAGDVSPASTAKTLLG